MSLESRFPDADPSDLSEAEQICAKFLAIELVNARGYLEDGGSPTDKFYKLWVGLGNVFPTMDVMERMEGRPFLNRQAAQAKWESVIVDGAETGGNEYVEVLEFVRWLKSQATPNN
jgi:hypothetical protein